MLRGSSGPLKEFQRPSKGRYKVLARLQTVTIGAAVSHPSICLTEKCVCVRLGAPEAAPVFAGAEVQPAPAPGAPEAQESRVCLAGILPRQGKFT